MNTCLKITEFGESEPVVRAVFLLLEQNPVIAADLIGTLEAATACHIIHVTKPDEILDALTHTPKLTAAFLEMSVPDLVGSEIEVALNHHRASIILTQDESHQDDAELRGWHMLVRPFTDQMVGELLTYIRNKRGAADCSRN